MCCLVFSSEGAADGQSSLATGGGAQDGVAVAADDDGLCLWMGMKRLKQKVIKKNASETVKWCRIFSSHNLLWIMPGLCSKRVPKETHSLRKKIEIGKVLHHKCDIKRPLFLPPFIIDWSLLEATFLRRASVNLHFLVNRYDKHRAQK